jgi:hypothetical protein
VPDTAAVRRRNVRTGVLSRRCATLSAKQAPVTSTPAGAIDSAFAQ